MLNLYKTITTMAIILLLSACGGGSDKSDPNPPAALDPAVWDQGTWDNVKWQ